jgi:ubiquitin-protein ligase E3 C
MNDLEDIDPSLATNMKWMLENEFDGEDLGLYYTYDTTILDKALTKELIPDGSSIPINSENKKDFIKKFCEMKMKKEIETQLKYFLHGFWSIYPQEWISNFSPSELQLLISGPQIIDLAEMKRKCIYKGHNPSDDLIIWLWEFLESLSQEQLCQFLFFLTGFFIYFD